MPALSASAPGKIILFGEHSVVYGRPALAAPVHQVHAKVMIKPAPGASPGVIHIHSTSIDLDAKLDELADDHPLKEAIRATQAHLGIARIPSCNIRISSTIPIAAGLGSGAAVSVALIRAVSAFLGQPLTNGEISELAFGVEQLHHGTPSGIDNTVVAFEKPIFFIKGQQVQFVEVSEPVLIIIADSGIPALTVHTVGGVRERWQKNPPEYEALFDKAGEIAQIARNALEDGDSRLLGRLMDQNQTILEQLGVSSPELEHLIIAARQAGAFGAKLSGGGGGGNMIALVEEDTQEIVANALRENGAKRLIITNLIEK